MNSLLQKRSAFILSHPFHYLVYKSLIQKLPDCIAVIETRKETPFDFSPEFINTLPCKHIVLDEQDLRSLDQTVDVIFCMTPKHVQKRFKIAKTVLVQYGMAKEIYNHGLWRCLADINLMYGPYSHSAISGHAVSAPVGNLRFDGFKPKQTGGAGVLYMPTYGELSSLGSFVHVLRELNPKVAIKIKLHHASEFADLHLIPKLKEFPNVKVVDAYTDAAQEIAAADLVISDYSGAMFDAAYLGRSLVLYQPPIEQTIKRTSEKSLEISRGSDFGHVITEPKLLADYLNSTIKEGYQAPKQFDRDYYFSNRGNVADAAIVAVSKMLDGSIERTAVQDSIKGTYQSLLAKASVHRSNKVLLKQIGKNIARKFKRP
jgi:hypothetical protein